MDGLNEAVVATIDDFCPKGEERIIIHSHINHKGKMVLNKVEAGLMIVELYKFINNEKAGVD